MLKTEEQSFIQQSDEFVEILLKNLGVTSLEQAPDITRRPAQPIEPVLISNYKKLTKEEKQNLIQSYFSPIGVAYFIVLNEAEPPQKSHILFHITEQIEDELNLHFPLEHPLEKHPEAIKRFGTPDGTLKVYDLDTHSGNSYREQGETSEKFDVHNDGLGSGGTVQTAVLYADGSPLFGGYTYFQNLPVIGLKLAKEDPEAFQSLFLPDALTMLRPRGKGALKVTTPIFYLGEDKQPQISFRLPTGEYQAYVRPDLPQLLRAWEFLKGYCEPFAYGSHFVHFTKKGHGCLIRNLSIVHGRTEFRNGSKSDEIRILARKWFMLSKRDSTYKHVPAIFVYEKYAKLFPQYFSSEYLEGEWLYDINSNTNKRVK